MFLPPQVTPHKLNVSGYKRYNPHPQSPRRKLGDAPLLTPVPFTLISLKLGTYHVPASTIEGILASASLTSLSLESAKSVNNASSEIVLDSFPRVAPRLLHLSLVCHARALLALLDLCTSLTHFHLRIHRGARDDGADFADIPRLVPSTLTDLTITDVHSIIRSKSGSEILLAHLSLPNVASLQQLHLVTRHGAEGGDDLRRACEERGLTFSEQAKDD